MKDEFGEYVHAWLPVIDEHLASRQCKVRARPLQAALYFVNNVITEVQGDTMENFSERSWFAILYWHIRQWYEEFYSERLLESSSEHVGLILLRGTPFQLEFPVTTAELEEEGVSSWMVFAAEVMPYESHNSFFTSPPNTLRQFLLDFNQQVIEAGGVLTKKEQAKATARYRRILKQAQSECPPPDESLRAPGKRGRMKRSKSRNL